MRFLSVLLACCTQPPAILETSIKGQLYTLELALDGPTRSKGLMHRPSIPEDGGMLFVYPKPRKRYFGVKHCLVDIDLIYLDTQGTVVALHEMKVEEPQAENESNNDYLRRLTRYPSLVPVQFVLEMRAGQIAALGISPGDQINLPYSLLIEQAR